MNKYVIPVIILLPNVAKPTQNKTKTHPDKALKHESKCMHTSILKIFYGICSPCMFKTQVSISIINFN